MKRALWVLTVALAASTASAQEALMVATQEPLPITGDAVSDAQVAAAIKAATAARTQGRRAPVVLQSNTAIFPFGDAFPTLSCAALRVCDVQLERGEVVRNVAIGDSERWAFERIESGSEDAPVPHVVFKPTGGYDFATNAIITTDRRTYHLGLEALSEKKLRSGDSYLRAVRFYYPDRWVESYTMPKRSTTASAAPAEAGETRTMESLTPAALDALHFGYRLSGKKTITWRPKMVFDDGEHVFIRLGRRVVEDDLPAVLTEHGGETATPNFRVVGEWLKIDQVHPKIVLQSGTGRKASRIVIRREG